MHLASKDIKLNSQLPFLDFIGVGAKFEITEHEYTFVLRQTTQSQLIITFAADKINGGFFGKAVLAIGAITLSIDELIYREDSIDVKNFSLVLTDTTVIHHTLCIGSNKNNIHKVYQSLSKILTRFP